MRRQSFASLKEKVKEFGHFGRKVLSGKWHPSCFIKCVESKFFTKFLKVFFFCLVVLGTHSAQTDDGDGGCDGDGDGDSCVTSDSDPGSYTESTFTWTDSSGSHKEPVLALLEEDKRYFLKIVSLSPREGKTAIDTLIGNPNLAESQYDARKMLALKHHVYFLKSCMSGACGFNENQLELVDYYLASLRHFVQVAFDAERRGLRDNALFKAGKRGAIVLAFYAGAFVLDSTLTGNSMSTVIPKLLTLKGPAGLAALVAIGTYVAHRFTNLSNRYLELRLQMREFFQCSSLATRPH